MKTYKVVLSRSAKDDLKKSVSYLHDSKKSPQAAKNLLDDFNETKSKLKMVAGSLKILDNQNFSSRGLRKIGFRKHKYYMIYVIDEATAYVTNIFHEREDAENKLK